MRQKYLSCFDTKWSYLRLLEFKILIVALKQFMYNLVYIDLILEVWVHVLGFFVVSFSYFFRLILLYIKSRGAGYMGWWGFGGGWIRGWGGCEGWGLIEGKYARYTF